MLSRAPIGSGNRGLWGGIATKIKNRRMVGSEATILGSLVVVRFCAEILNFGSEFQM
jgi:hypothetical protein